MRFSKAPGLEPTSGKAVIAVALTDPADRETVIGSLSGLGHEPVVCPAEGVPPADLFILDPPSAGRLGPQVLELKERTDVFLPTMVALQRADSFDRWFAAGFDMALRLPVLDGDLKAGVDALLRLRRRSQAAARQSQERWLALFEHTGAATILVDEDATILLANQRCLSVTGYSPEELRGTKWTRFVAPESLEKMLRYHKARREQPGAAPPHYDARLIDKSGRIRTAYVSASILPGSRQSIVSMIDVTERQEALEALRESETRHRIITELISDYAYIFRVTEDGKLRGEWVTESFNKTFGLTLEQVDDRGGWQALVLPEDIPAALRHARKVADGQADVCEMRCVTSSGDVRWLRDYAQPVLDNSGRVTRVYGAAQDITECKRAEEVVRQREHLFSSLFHLHAAVQLLIDPVTQQVLDANESAARFYGWPRERLMQMRLQDLDLSTSDEIAEVLEQLEANNQAQFDTRHRLADGSTREVAVFSTRIDVGGEVVAYSIVQDITAHKKAERELRVSEENFRRLMEESPLGITIVSEDGETFFINAAALEMFGCESIEEWRETPVEQRYSKTSYAEHRRRRARRKQGKTIPPEYEVEIVTKGGEKRRLQVWRRPVVWNSAECYQVVYRDVTEIHNAQESLSRTLDRLQRSFFNIIRVMVSTVEARDPYTAGHQFRVANLAGAIAKELRLPPATVECVRMAGAIHDVGKLSVPGEILSKPARVSEVEHSLIRRHPRVGYEMLKDVEFPWPIAEIVYQHHERMDGSGYPRNLKGDEIRMEARIVAVADVVEAISSHRPYRPALGWDSAMEEISRNRGVLYDVDVVDACLRLFQEKGYRLA